MEPQSEEGIQRLEEPVSRTTLKSWGGLPIEISEKSVGDSQLVYRMKAISDQRTLGIEEVLHGNEVATILVDRGLAEHLLGVLLGADTHVLLTKASHVVTDVVLLLRSSISGDRYACYLDGELTSCSDRGTFWSFILWTAALADPSSAVAAAIELPFIIAITTMCNDLMGMEKGKVEVEEEQS